MYICDNGHVFDEPATGVEDFTPGGAFEGGSFLCSVDYGCPICGSNYEEAYECDCGEYTTHYSHKCPLCLAELKDEFIACFDNKYTENEFNFLSFVYSYPDRLVRAAERHHLDVDYASKLFEDFRVEYNRYVDVPIDCFEEVELNFKEE